MTLITFQDGKVVMNGDAVGTEQACCCCTCSIQSGAFASAACFIEGFCDRCDLMEAEFIRFKGELEAAGYTVDLQPRTQEELAEIFEECECEPCGWRMSFTCDSCSEQWFQPFDPEDTDGFYLVQGTAPYNDIEPTSMSAFITCPPDAAYLNSELAQIDSRTVARQLIAFATDALLFIPYCGNPLP